MHTPKTLQRELDRLLAISWVYDESQIRSGAKLIREYLRGAALWATALRIEDDWAFCDISKRVESSINIGVVIERQVREHLATLQINSFEIERVLVWHLEWAAGYDIGLFDKYELSNPYEPLIQLFERGMTFDVDKGFVSVCGVGGIPIGRPEDHLACQPIVELDR